MEFFHFVNFVKEVAADMSDPLCSPLIPIKSRSAGSRSMPSKENVLVSQGSSKNRSGEQKSSKSQGGPRPTASSRSASVRTKHVCVVCGEGHGSWRCVHFKDMSVKDRKQLVLEHALCFNCLNPGHMASECPRPATCLICSQKHSVYLHSDVACAVSDDSAFMPVVSVRVDGKQWAMGYGAM